MPLIMNPGHGITLGGLPLVASGKPVTNAAGFTTEVSTDGTTWGNPEVVVSSLISELSDGDIVTQTRSGNREPVLYVRLSADTHAGLIAGDGALSAVVGSPCELSWQPPDPAAPLTVIDVVHSRMDHAWDDMDSRRRRRTWIVTMSALPWPRSATKVITPAVATASTTVVNAGSATPGWSSTNGTVTVVSGAVVSTYNAAVPSGIFYGTDLKLTGSVSTNPQHYVAVDWKSSVPAYQYFTVPGRSPLTEVRREPAPTATYTRSWYQVPDNTITDFNFFTIHTAGTGSATLSIDQVIKSETLPVTGTARQLTKTITPGGNVPAEGDILIQHASNSLGRTIVFSHPAGGGYTPSLRQWLTSSSGPIANAGMVSGFYNDLTAPMVYSIPISAIPESGAQLWIKLGAAATTAIRINWSATSWQGGVPQVNSRQSGNTLIQVPSVGPQYLFPIGNLTLPPSRVADSGSGYVVIIVEKDASSSATNATLDETWVFATDRGRLTVVDCGDTAVTSGTSASRLRISAPSLARPYGEIQLATVASYGDSWEPAGANVLCDQTGHRFDPETGTIIFTVTANTLDAGVSLEHYNRWRAEAGN